MQASSQRLWVDALGELAEVDGDQVWWDTASALPSLVQHGQVSVIAEAGVAGTTGGPDAGWLPPQWSARDHGTNPMDPWAVSTTAGAVDGAVSEGMMHFAEPGPHTVGGFLGSVAMGGAGGGVFAGAGHALGQVTGWVRNACFTADTEVLMADGTAKQIDQIAVGDMVGAYNPDTNQVEPREVEAVFVHENVATWRVSTEHGDITTTAAHPFYVQGQGWTPAEELREGDQLQTDAGRINTVVEVAATGDTATVHTFTVTGLHNYHIATKEGTWILVHNSCAADIPTDGMSGVRSAGVAGEQAAGITKTLNASRP